MPNTMIERTELKEILQERFNEDLFWEELSDNTLYSKEIAKSLLEDDCHLDRLLTARNHDADNTVALFWDQIRFRAKYKPESISPSSMPTALPSGAWRMCGFDKKGNVISNYKLHHWDPEQYNDNVDEAIEEYTLFVCYFVELMLRSGKENACFSLIFDLEGFYLSMATQEKVRLMIRKLIYVAQAQYPERLGRVYLVNAPYGFSTAWSLIKVLLDAKTADKITFCTLSELLDDIDETVLSVEYGGQHEEYPTPSGTIEEESKLVQNMQ